MSQNVLLILPVCDFSFLSGLDECEDSSGAEERRMLAFVHPALSLSEFAG